MSDVANGSERGYPEDDPMTDLATAPSGAPSSQPARSVTLTAAAARRIARLAEAEGNPNLMLRVAVSGGGCSGFQYGFSFDEALTDEDRVFERDGVKLVVDEVSLTLLGGAEVDYVEELVGASFQVKNPNAKSSCGCGSSFAV
jgi:iron-sulfur cluster insertion protein